MKKVFTILAISITYLSSQAQTLEVVPSPSGYDSPSNYGGSPVQVGNKLYLKYLNNSSSQFDLIVYDGVNLTPVASSALYPTAFYYGNAVLFGTESFVEYGNGAPGLLQKYNGTTMSAPVVPSGQSYKGGMAMMGSDMYMSLQASANNNKDLFKFNGVTFTEITSPTGYTGVVEGYSGNPFVVNNNVIYLRYRSGASATNPNSFVLFKYDGTTLTEIPAPVGYVYQQTSPVAVGTTIYLQYSNSTNNNVLFKYDGSTLTEIPSPFGYNDPGKGYVGSPIVVGTDVYLRYLGNDDNSDLFKYDGTTLTAISSPAGVDNPSAGYTGSPILMGSDLYLKYKGNDGNSDLYKYDGTTLTEIPSPAGFDAVNGYDGYPIIYGSDLYLSYRNSSYNNFLFKYNGTSLTQVNTPANFKRYSGDPIIYGTDLYINATLTNNDKVLMKLDLTCMPSSSSFAVNQCGGSYTVPSGNMTYSTSQTVNDTIPNVSCGADSIMTIAITINNSVTGTDVQTACGSYTWVNGNGSTYNSSTNSPTHNIVAGAANGCDSLVTLNLTINNSTTGADVQTACGSYTWINGTTYSSSTSSPTHNIVGGAANGCDSLVTLDLTITPLPNNGTTTSGNTISANQTGASYQWIDCNNSNSVISGETNIDFTATTNGDYAVIVTNNGCSDTSACVNMSTVGVNENVIANQVSFYPNPTKGNVVFQLGNLKDVSISVFSLTGKLVYQATNINTSTHQLALNNASGFYIVNVTANGESQQFKLIKE